MAEMTEKPKMAEKSKMAEKPKMVEKTFLPKNRNGQKTDNGRKAYVKWPKNVLKMANKPKIAENGYRDEESDTNSHLRHSHLWSYSRSARFARENLTTQKPNFAIFRLQSLSKEMYSIRMQSPRETLRHSLPQRHSQI